MTTEQNQLQRRMRAAMQKNKMTAVRLSDESGVGYLTVRRFLNGTNDTTTDRLIKMLDVLGLHITQKGTGA